MIYRVLREQPQRTLVYTTKASTIIIPPTGPIRTGSPPFVVASERHMIKLKIPQDALVVADSIVPPPMSIPTLVVSSPGLLANRELTDTLNSYNTWLHLPLPTNDEVRQLRDKAFPHVNETQFEKRLQLWGPIPRHVLVITRSRDQAALWAKARSVSLSQLEMVARGYHSEGPGYPGDARDAPHRVVHERSAGQDAPVGSPEADPANEDYYNRGSSTIASGPLAHYVASRIKKESLWNAAFLINMCVSFGTLAGLRGLKFEEVMLDALSKGMESIKCRKLDDHSLSTLTTPPGPRVEWSDVKSLPGLLAKQHSHSRGTKPLLVPSKRDQAGLDALVWIDADQRYWPLDCTESPRHTISGAGLLAVVEALGWSAETGWPRGDNDPVNMTIKYFWALPEDRFHGTDWRKSRTIRDIDSDPKIKELANHVEQYALCMPSEVTIEKFVATLEESGVQSAETMIKNAPGDDSQRSKP